MRQRAWHDGAAGKVSREKVVIDGHTLVADGILARNPLEDPVDQQEGVPARRMNFDCICFSTWPIEKPARHPRPVVDCRDAPVGQDVHDLLNVLEGLHAGPALLNWHRGGLGALQGHPTGLDRASDWCHGPGHSWPRGGQVPGPACLAGTHHGVGRNPSRHSQSRCSA